MTNVLIRQIQNQVARGKNLAVVLRFMRFVGMDEQLIKDTLASEHGHTVIDMAGTIVYEAEIQKASKAFLQNRAASLPMPVLMLAGTKSFKTAPAIGAAMAELMLDGAATTADISAFSVDRFARGRLIEGEHPYEALWR